MITFEDIIKLADNGNINAMVAAIQEFVWNSEYDENEPEIRKRIEEYLIQAITAGNVTAMNQLGAMYGEGRLVEYDLKESYKWYKMASDRGDALATSNLGFCYMYGKGTEQNYEKAYIAFSKAALLGIGDAIIRVGDMYLFGNYVDKDPRTAYSLYLRAERLAKNDLNDWGMQQVYSDVMRRLGDCYYYGEVVPKSLTKAIECYSTALEYYEIRESKGDSYSSEGYRKTKEKLIKTVHEMED